MAAKKRKRRKNPNSLRLFAAIPFRVGVIHPANQSVNRFRMKQAQAEAAES